MKSKPHQQLIANCKRTESEEKPIRFRPVNRRETSNPGDGHGEKDSCRFRHCDDHDGCLGSMHEPHDLQRQPHRDMHNVLLRQQLLDELLLRQSRKRMLANGRPSRRMHDVCGKQTQRVGPNN